MSFGVGIGDVVTVGSLAWTLFSQAKDAPAGFSGVADEALTLHTIVENVKNQLSLKTIDEQSGIRRALDGCYKVLKELLQLLDKHKSLASSRKKLKDRVQWSDDRVRELRSQLISYTSMLDALLGVNNNEKLADITNSLQQLHTTTEDSTTGLAASLESGFSNIEARLEMVLQSFQARQSKASLATVDNRAASVVSFYTADSIDIDERRAWQALRQDFTKQGITAKDFEKHKDSIIRWLTDAIIDGKFEDRLAELVWDPISPQNTNGRESFETARTEFATWDTTLSHASSTLSFPVYSSSETPAFRSRGVKKNVTLSEYSEIVRKGPYLAKQLVVKEIIRRLKASQHVSLNLVEALFSLVYSKLLRWPSDELWDLAVGWLIDIEILKEVLLNPDDVLRTLAVQLPYGIGAFSVVLRLANGDTSITAPMNEKMPKNLHVAAATGNLEVVRALIDAGADVNMACANGLAPLHYASCLALAQALGKGQRPDVVNSLLQAGADCNARTNSGTTYPAGHTALHLALGSFVLLSSQKKLLDHALRDETSTLFKDCFSIIGTLLKCGIDIDAQIIWGYTALHFAVYRGSVPIVRLLLSCGADSKIQDHYNMTPHAWANLWRNKTITQVFEQHA